MPKQSMLKNIDNLLVYPNEDLLWGSLFTENKEKYFDYPLIKKMIRLPFCKANLQYLSHADYIYKNFLLQQMITACNFLKKYFY